MLESPKGWRRFEMGEVLRLRSEGGLANDPLLSVTSDRGVVPQVETGRRDASNNDKSMYRRVYPGDIVYNTMRMWQGVSGRSAHFGIVSPAYTVCSPTGEIDTRFMRHVLKLPEYVSIFKGQSQGLVSDTWNLKYSAFKSISVDIPPLWEQRRIADILESIDELIRSAEVAVAKLATVRAGVMADLIEQRPARAVHNSSASWRTSNLGSIADVSGGVALGRSLAMGGTVELPYLRVANVQSGRITTSDLRYVRIPRSEVDRYSLKAGDFLMTEGGDFDKLGRGAVWDGSISPCLHQNHVFRVRVDESRLHPQFLSAYTRSDRARRYFINASKQTTNLATINIAQVRAFPVPVPPLADQKKLIEAIASCDQRVQVGEKELSKLQRLKQGLADDLLTGRRRVREREGVTA